MILGGELTAKQIKFDAGFDNAAHHLKSMFTARGSFFLVPPYDERVDVSTDDRFVQFSRHDGGSLSYEDTKYILSKIQLFQAITPDKAQEFLETARGLLPCVSTLLFPDPRRTLVECAVYENWVRFDFSAQQFSDLAGKIRADIVNYFPPHIKITANTEQEITLRTEKGDRLLLSHNMLQKLAAVLVSYGVLPPELHARFVLNAEQFALMQGTRLYLHYTLYAIKDAESVGGAVYATYASDQALRVLKQLAEHGEIGLLKEGDAVFLSHVQLFSPKEYKAFEGVHGLRKFMECFIAAYGPEIRILHDIRLQEKKDSSGTYDPTRINKEDQDIIEGSTAKTIERDEEYRRLAERYQKKLGE